MEERLPEEEKPVLVQFDRYDKYLDMMLKYMDVMSLYDGDEKVFTSINRIPAGEIVAWCPLPEPYWSKGQSRGDGIMNSTKKWSEVTEKEICKIQRDDCRYCKNASVLCVNPSAGKRCVCMYIAYHRQSRTCRPGECRQSGVFAPKSVKRRRPYLR